MSLFTRSILKISKKTLRVSRGVARVASKVATMKQCQTLFTLRTEGEKTDEDNLSNFKKRSNPRLNPPWHPHHIFEEKLVEFQKNLGYLRIILRIHYMLKNQFTIQILNL